MDRQSGEGHLDKEVHICANAAKPEQVRTAAGVRSQATAVVHVAKSIDLSTKRLAKPQSMCEEDTVSQYGRA